LLDPLVIAFVFAIAIIIALIMTTQVFIANFR
jgi:hypothetical protein